MVIRPEMTSDQRAVQEINTAAFEEDAEAKLVDALRENAEHYVAFVAEVEGRVVGHICFSEMTCAGNARLMGLAPMAVLPDFQSKGIGSALVTAGLEACREMGMDGVAVLGHPTYYPRFGFKPASAFGIKCVYDVPEGVFMVQELKPDGLKQVSGTINYHQAFRDLG